MPPVMQKMQGECQDPCEATQVLGSDIRWSVAGQDGRLEILRLINATDGKTRGEMLGPALEKMLEVGATVSQGG
jgi:hypothetical protein